MRRKITVRATAIFRLMVFDSILRRCTAFSPVSSSFEWHNFVVCSAHSFVDTAPSWRLSKTSSLNLLLFLSFEENGDGSPETYSTMREDFVTYVGTGPGVSPEIRPARWRAYNDDTTEWPRCARSRSTHPRAGLM